MNLLKKSSLPLLLLLLWLAPAWADALSDFTSSRAINAPYTSVLILDLKNGQELVSLNADKPLIPASIMKGITTATLLDKTGAKFQYETKVYLSGKISGGEVNGDLVVVGSGDPSINTRHSPGSVDFVDEIVQWLKQKQITQIKGRIVVDESAFPGPAVNPSWSAGDLPHAYGTGTHGFNFEDNATGNRSVKDPAATFKSRLLAALNKNGIQVREEGIAAGDRITLGVHRSEQIDDIMRSCMMRSDNQFAEAFMRLVGNQYGGEGSTSRGTSETMKFWRHNNARMEGVNIVDGSGLSRQNRLTANFMSDVLRYMSRNPYYASFFPLAGQEGTLRKFLAGTALDGEIAMKTGSMNGIQCYAGYKLDENYEPTHVVVVMMNEMADRTKARAEVERLLLSTFKDE